jgi:hypothetical protein
MRARWFGDPHLLDAGHGLAGLADPVLLVTADEAFGNRELVHLGAELRKSEVRRPQGSGGNAAGGVEAVLPRAGL